MGKYCEVCKKGYVVTKEGEPRGGLLCDSSHQKKKRLVQASYYERPSCEALKRGGRGALIQTGE